MRHPMISRGHLGCWTHLCSQVGASISLSSHTGHACLVQVSCVHGVHGGMNSLILDVVCKVLGISRKLTKVFMVMESIGASGHHLAHVVCFLSTQNGHV